MKNLIVPFSEIENYRGKIEYSVNENCIFVHIISINSPYRGKHYPSLIFKCLQRKFKKPIILDCFWTIESYYLHLGFKRIEDEDEQGYLTMQLDYNKNL